jgi:nicotinamidase-related amidase
MKKYLNQQGTAMLLPETTLLLVIDIQGNLARGMYERDALYENLQKIIRGIQVLEIPIIVTEQIPEKLGPTIPEISSLFDNFNPIPKSSFSCCGDEKIMNAISTVNRRQILIAGIESHVCLYQTTLDLIQAGYEVHIVADCISSRTAENRAIGIERMKEAGAKLTSTEMALFELLKVAEGDNFREIVRIVK